jgi:hypothetical protein
MSRQRGKATLAGVKGAELLSALKAALVPSKPPEQLAPPQRHGSARPPIEQELTAVARRRAPFPTKRVQHGIKKAKEPQKEVIKVRDRQLFMQMVKAAQSFAAPQTITRKIALATSDLGASAFDRVTRLHGTVTSFTANHRGGAEVSNADRELVAKRIKASATDVVALVDRDDGHFIGYDFGTSTTKAVARHPYNLSKPAFAVDVPLMCASGGQTHLWPTVVWWDRATDRFSALPAESAICLDSFKSALIEGQARQICCASGMSMEEAATAFLTLHIAYMLGSCRDQAESFKLAGINFGVPVAALAEAKKVRSFERVVRAALSLVPLSTRLSLADVRTALGCENESAIPFNLFTELAGAIAGYCAAPRYYVGGHMIVDCGSATLDMASFLLDGTTSKPVCIYDARVEALGADACTAYAEAGASVEDCRNAARWQEHLVFKGTRESARARFMQDEGRYPYQVILIGGGIHSDVHEPLFERMEAAFHRPFHRPQLSLGLQFDEECEPGRLILADGLARDPIDLREVAMPRDLPPLTIYQAPEMITKDQV